MKLLIGVFCSCVAPVSLATELVKACDLGTHSTRRVEIVRDSKIASTHIYYLRQDGKRSPLFESPELSRGDSVHVECVGKNIRALVVSGEFTANARQGFVIISRPGSDQPERLDFAEKSYPRWLYLGAREIIVVIPTFRYGETSAKYVAYHHVAGQTGEAQVDAISQLPSPSGFEVVKLKAPFR